MVVAGSRRPVPVNPAASLQLAALVVAAGVVVAGVLTWLQYPGFIAVWVAVWVASLQVLAPEPLPAKQVADAGYEQQVAVAGAWHRLRVALLFPTGIAAPGAWPLRPMVAVCVGVVVWGFPAGGAGVTIPVGSGLVAAVLPPDTAGLLAVVNGWAAGVLVVEVPVSMTAARVGVAVPPSWGEIAAWVRDRAHVGSLVGAVLAGGIVAGAGWGVVGSIPQVAVWVTQPVPVVVAVGVGVACVIVWGAVAGATAAARRARAESEAAWRSLWRDALPKVFAGVPPRVVERVQVSARCVVETFQVSAATVSVQSVLTPGAGSLSELVGRVAAADATVAVLPVADAAGAVSRSLFRVATWTGDAFPDMLRPGGDVAEQQVAVEMMLALAAGELQAPAPLLVSLAQISGNAPGGDGAGSEGVGRRISGMLAGLGRARRTPGRPRVRRERVDRAQRYAQRIAAITHTPPPVPAADEVGETLAWMVTYRPLRADVDPVGTLVALLPGFVPGVEVVHDPGVAPTTIYFGALWADSTRLDDPGLRERLRGLVEQERWAQRWADTLPAAKIPMGQAPHAAILDRKESWTLVLPPGGREVTLTALPFLVTQGTPLEGFTRATTEQALRTALNGAPMLQIARWADPRAGEGGRYNKGFVVVWSDGQVPQNPAQLPAQLTAVRGESRAVAVRVMNCLFAHAFDVAKLERPEVVEAVAVTDERSTESIWRVRVRLYGVALAMVRAKLPQLQAALGCEWLQVAAVEASADMVEFGAGAHPASGGVDLSGPRMRRARTWCTRLLWEGAFQAAGLVTAFGAPVLTDSDDHPDNPEITVSTFTLPVGKTVADVQAVTDRLAAAVGVGFLQVRAGATSNAVVILSALRDPMPYPALVPWRVFGDSGSPLRIPFGASVEGGTVSWDVALSPHLLVLGGTGSGKSVALVTLVAGALARGFEVCLADPTKGGADFQELRPWMRALAVEVPHAQAMLAWVNEEKDRRKRVNAEHGVGSYRELPDGVRPAPMLVVLDEFTSLMLAEFPKKPPVGASPEELAVFATQFADAQGRSQIASTVGRLAREARSAGIHVLLATQKLTAKTLAAIPGGDLKSQMARLALGQMTWGDLSSALRSPQDAQQLRVPAGVVGRGIFESDAAPVGLVQSWYAAEDGVSHQGRFAVELARLVPRVPEGQVLDLVAAVSSQQGQVTVFGQEKSVVGEGSVVELAGVSGVVEFDDVPVLLPESPESPVVADVPVLSPESPVVADEPVVTVEADGGAPVRAQLLVSAGTLAAVQRPSSWVDATEQRVAGSLRWVSASVCGMVASFPGEVTVVAPRVEIARQVAALVRSSATACTVDEARARLAAGGRVVWIAAGEPDHARIVPAPGVVTQDVLRRAAVVLRAG